MTLLAANSSAPASGSRLATWIFFAVVFWLATVYWIYKDAKRRLEDPWLIGVGVMLGVIVPFLGVFVYMLFRPPEYMEEVRERELEIKAMEDRLSKRDLHCPVCRSEVDISFLVCRSARRSSAGVYELQAAARGAVAGCPYCETPVEPAAVALPSIEPPRRRHALGALATNSRPVAPGSAA